MHALVTGGAGFIGSHLVDRLIKDGHVVTVCDNLCTGRQENLKQHIRNRNVRMVHGDVTGLKLSDLKGYEQGKKKSPRSIREKIDWVFHLAARADIVPSVTQPREYHRTNVDGTVHVLEEARRSGVKRYIYAASASCYGMPSIFPTPETAPPNPQYPYALTKWVGEQYVLHWGKIYRLPVVSLRLFNVYGPRSRTTGAYGAVFGTFLAQKVAGKPMTVVGDGTQTRDFTFVTDVVDACIKAAESDVTDEVFNVGTGKPQSVNRLVELLGGDVVYIPKRPGEPHKTQADIRKIKKKLGWHPKVSFEEGVHELLKNISHWNKAPVWTPRKIARETQAWFRYLMPE